MRIANLTVSISRQAGGLFDAVRRPCQEQLVPGAEIRVFGAEDPSTAADLPAWHPVPALAVRSIGPRSFGYSPGFLEELRKFDPDVMHSHGLWSYASVATLRHARRTGSPYVVSPHGMLDPWALRNSSAKKRIARWLFEDAHLRRARCVRALCESEARSIRQLGLQNDIAIIPNGIDRPSGSPSAEPPWQGFVPADGKVMLFLSRIHPKKGLPNLLRAWSAAMKVAGGAGNNWVLAVAGWDQGGHELELKQLATELGMRWEEVRDGETVRQYDGTAVGQDDGTTAGRDDGTTVDRFDRRTVRPSDRPTVSPSGRPTALLFLGPQFNEAKATCYHHCDAFVLPSFSEGVPMVVLEAWAHGKPVLMTPECNLPEGFAREAAMKIETNPESIARGLAEFWSWSDTQRVAIGEQGRLLVKERFAWPHLARQMVEVYEWMLGGRSRPSCMADF